MTGNRLGACSSVLRLHLLARVWFSYCGISKIDSVSLYCPGVGWPLFCTYDPLQGRLRVEVRDHASLRCPVRHVTASSGDAPKLDHVLHLTFLRKSRLLHFSYFPFDVSCQQAAIKSMSWSFTSIGHLSTSTIAGGTGSVAESPTHPARKLPFYL